MTRIAPLPLHAGPLHAVEWVMFLVLLLGPFVALAAVVVTVRRRDTRDTRGQHDQHDRHDRHDAHPHLPEETRC